jgi:hypothetical protein
MSSRKIIAVFVCVFWNVAYLQAQQKIAKQSTSDKGTIYFDKNEIYFGRINEEGGTVEHTFTFKNIGSGSLNILSVETGCGCTASEYPTTPIKPKEEASIKIVFDPRKKLGELNRTITVITDGNPQKAYLTIKGNVQNLKTALYSVYPFRQGNILLSANAAQFNLKDTQRDSIVLSIYNDSKKTIHITGFKSPAYIRAEVGRKTLMDGDHTTLKIVYYADAANDYGFKNDELYINTTDDSVPRKAIIIKSTITQDFSNRTAKEAQSPPIASFPIKEHDFGEIYVGEEVIFNFPIKNLGKSDLRIQKVKSNCGCTITGFTREFIKRNKIGQITVKLNAKDLRGNVAKDVYVFVNDPDNPMVVLRVKARVIIPGIDPITK